MRPFIRLVASATITIVLAAPVEAWAVDTTESFDGGAVDVDFFVGFDGVGLVRHERQLSGDLMLGYGIIPGLSAYLGAAFAADEYLSNGAGEAYLGVLGTPLDTDHVDLDLFVDFRLGGDGLSSFQVGPAAELNLDLVPDLGLWGVYLVVGVPIYGQGVVEQSGDAPARTAFHVETTIGTYLTMGERHQLLLDFSMALRPRATDGERQLEVGSVGFGYNVTVHESVELITEVRLDIPQGGEPLAVGIVAGFIATVPSARAAGVR